MGIIELFILAVGLSMDAFAVSICKGISLGKASIAASCWVGLWFGAFQALMPTIGFYLGTTFENYIKAIDHWVAFILLLIIGIQMIRESLSKDEDEIGSSLGVKTMLVLAVATSIDALASGIAIAAAQGDMGLGALFIGLITFTLSSIGVRAGSRIGSGFGHKAEFGGGVVLIVIGLRILISHLTA